MSRKNRSPEENARREKIRKLLQMANIGSMADIQNLFKETIAEFMEKDLEAELDDELGYSKYDYKSKDTDNSRNGHSSKTLRTSFGDVEVSVPRDRKGEFEPQVLKKNQTSISQDIEEKILSMYAKGMTTSDIEAHLQDNLRDCLHNLHNDGGKVGNQGHQQFYTRLDDLRDAVDEGVHDAGDDLRDSRHDGGDDLGQRLDERHQQVDTSLDDLRDGV